MRLVAAQPHTSPDDSPLRELTERERKVLASIGRGPSNDEIARELFISPATARSYVSRLLTKLRARDRARLVVLAYETGLVTPRSSLERPVRELVYLVATSIDGFIAKCDGDYGGR